VLAGLEADYEGQCDVSAAAAERTYVHQKPYLFRGTVLSNVTYGLRARGEHRAAAAKVALDWLDRFGIGELASRRTDNLSGGEARRVALARAVVLAPRLLLLDEPLSDMDAEGIAAVGRVLAELPEMTVVIASPAAVRPELASVELRIETPS